MDHNSCEPLQKVSPNIIAFLHFRQSSFSSFRLFPEAETLTSSSAEEVREGCARGTLL